MNTYGCLGNVPNSRAHSLPISTLKLWHLWPASEMSGVSVTPGHMVRTRTPVLENYYQLLKKCQWNGEFIQIPGIMPWHSVGSAKSHNEMFCSNVHWTSSHWLQSQDGGDVDDDTSFAALFLGHILHAQKGTADNGILQNHYT